MDAEAVIEEQLAEKFIQRRNRAKKQLRKDILRKNPRQLTLALD